jgi:hypothetical protein
MGRAEDLFERLSKNGPAEIDLLIEDRQAEELFLDFKRSADGGTGRRFHDRDRQNLAKAISGFGNSEGGVIVWGVDCRDRLDIGDVAAEKVPIANPKRFVSWLESAVSGCTIPPHPKVQHAAIQAPRSSKGFVVTYIAKSPLAPHQCVQPPQYYMRAGSNFMPVPHGVLAGMFGRAPLPSVFHTWVAEQVIVEPGIRSTHRARLSATIMLHNAGPGMARHVYINFQLFPPESGMEIDSQVLDTDWTGATLAGMVVSVIAPEPFRLAPGGHVPPVTFNLRIEPPFSGRFSFRVSYGAEGTPLTSIEKTVTASDLEELYRASRSALPERLNRLFTDALLPNYPLERTSN